MNDTPPPSFYASPSGQDPQPAGQPYPSSGPQDTRAIPLSPEPPRQERRSGRGALVAAVLTGSLLVGGLAGVAGAEVHDRWLDDDEAAQTSSRDDTSTAPVIDQGTPEAGQGSVEAVAAQVLPSVVRIDVAAAGESGSGSGIVLTEDGQILTNEHVVAAAGEDAQISISFADGTRAQADVLGTDPLTDTAVIKAQEVSGLTPATIGQSANLRVGQSVVAIGSPFGLDATVTSGIVSALDRPVNVGSDQEGNSTTYPAVQTDAAINPGNSGGPLVDLTGSVVGINSSIRTSSSAVGGQAGSIGLGFAIPIDEIMPIVEQMAAGETPTHARMGVQVRNSAADPDAAAMGALVDDVTSGSSAAEAGVEEGDVITRVDDNVIEGADDLVATVRTYRPGDQVQVSVVRGDEEQTLTLTLDSDADDD